MAVLKEKAKSSSEIEGIVDEQPSTKLLSDTPIYYWSSMQQKQLPAVPPSTPKYVTSIVEIIKRFPTEEFPPLSELELPYVKEVGIKKCIEILGAHLGYTNFAFDHLQFWFLDMLTDCVRKAQDEYHLPQKEQKIVLEWMLYVFKIMTDPTLNYSRKKFFAFFKEAILLAGDVITEGGSDVLLPQNLFTLVPDVEKDGDGDSDGSESVSTISVSTFDSEDIIDLKLGDQTKEYIVRKGLRRCSSGSSTSSESLSDDTTSYAASAKTSNDTVDPQEEPVDYTQFYKADPKIPKRFLPLPAKAPSLESASSMLIKTNEEKEDYSGKTFVMDLDYLDKVPPSDPCSEKNVEDKQSIGTQATIRSKKVSTVLNQDEKSDLLVKLTDSQVLQKLAQCKRWEQRMKDMDDPRKGWVPVEKGAERIEDDEGKSGGFDVDQDFNELIPEASDDDYKEDNRRLVSMGVLCAIVDLVFEYFYQSFHFTLIKMATLSPPHTITQALNTEWKVPKANKEELQKPKPLPKKKEPKPKRPPKKEKESQKSKKPSQKSDKSSEGKAKKNVIDKKTKKPEKPKKPSKEEKVELERQRKEQEEMEEEMRRREENQRFMFPLKDAATDELFMEIFKNWAKPVEKEVKGKKGGKDKGKKKK